MSHATCLKRHNPCQADFTALVAVCEINYWRLRKLLLPVFPSFREGAAFVLRMPGLSPGTERQFLLQVTERSPYTSTLEFSEIPENLSPWGLSPRLVVRIYHDARTSEVISFQGQRHFLGRYEYPNALMRQRDEKLQLNNLLADWLNHCLQQGYRSYPDAAVHPRL